MHEVRAASLRLGLLDVIRDQKVVVESRGFLRIVLSIEHGRRIHNFLLRL
jgi:hypothetical protein